MDRILDSNRYSSIESAIELSVKFMRLIRTRPIVNALRHRVGRSTQVGDVADKVETIEAETTGTKPAAIFLPSELEKAKAVQHETSWEAEMRRISENEITHKALIRYEISDVLVFRFGCSTKGVSFLRYGRVPIRTLLSEPIVALDKAHYSMPPVAVPYFGHWLCDAVATALLTRDDEDLILPVPKIWPHAQEYAALFELKPHTGSLYHVNKLVIHDDVGQGCSRTLRYRELRRRIRRIFGKGGTERINERIFLRRGFTGTSRVIANEDELVRRLKQNGFVIVDVTDASVADIMKVALDAAVCVTIEGSQQDHALMFLRENGALLNIQPANRFNCVVIDRAHPLGLHYGFVVANAADNGFSVDGDSLLATLEMIERRRNASPY